MTWIVADDTPAPMLRWTTTLTADQPETGPLALGLVKTATVQVEGIFGTAAVELVGSNSGTGYVPLHVVRHQDLELLPPVAYLAARLDLPNEETAVTITVAGHR